MLALTHLHTFKPASCPMQPQSDDLMEAEQPHWSTVGITCLAQGHIGSYITSSFVSLRLDKKLRPDIPKPPGSMAARL